LKRAWKAVLAGLFVAAIAMPATALTSSEPFTGWTPVGPLTDATAEANGWNYNAGGTRDVELVASGIDGQSIRMSNAATDSSFGDWLYSQKIAPVYEDANGNEFIATFDIQSATGVYQPGLQISVSPQSGIVNGDGARMSFLRFEDTDGGIDVTFVDNQADDGATQRAVKIADNLSRTISHEVTIKLDLYEGAHNDIANVFIDGSGPLVPNTVTGGAGFFAPVDQPNTYNKLKAGQSVPMKWTLGSVTPPTTWEDYYRFQAESNAGIDPLNYTTRPVESLIFQARDSGGAAPASLGKGFFIDNVALDSSDTVTLPNPTTTPGDASVYTDPIFTATKIVCPNGAVIDPIEEVATPGASHLTYDATTGVWHYNWQTKGVVKAGDCVKLVLNLTGQTALFQIVK